MTHSRDDSSASNPIGRMNFDCPRSKTEELNKHVQTSKGRDSREKYKFYLNFRLNRRAKKSGNPLEPIKSPMMITMKFYDSKANIFEKIHLQPSLSA